MDKYNELRLQEWELYERRRLVERGEHRIACIEAAYRGETLPEHIELAAASQPEPIDSESVDWDDLLRLRDEIPKRFAQIARREASVRRRELALPKQAPRSVEEVKPVVAH